MQGDYLRLGNIRLVDQSHTHSVKCLIIEACHSMRLIGLNLAGLRWVNRASLLAGISKKMLAVGDCPQMTISRIWRQIGPGRDDR